ncbi:MAG: hypothetical protein ACRDJN_29160, partial [Chloroflexota bacterium]
MAAMGLMFWTRAAFQVRTLPERVMEWLLLFVPLDAFEQGIRTFGPLAKVLALYSSVAVMAGALFGLGVLTLRRRWPGAAILMMALLLFLLAMAGLMPLTGAGLFATGLFQHPLLVNGSYLGVALAYATVLLAERVFTVFTPINQIDPPPSVAAARAGVETNRTSRRALALGAAGTVGAYALTLRQAAAGATAGSDLPLAELPSSLGAPYGPAPT